MIANINPSNTTYEDSHNTLKYSNRAKNIKVNPSMKETKQDSTWMEREQRLREENAMLKKRIAELESIIEGFQNGITSIPQFKMEEEIANVNIHHEDDSIEIINDDVIEVCDQYEVEIEEIIEQEDPKTIDQDMQLEDIESEQLPTSDENTNVNTKMEEVTVTVEEKIESAQKRKRCEADEEVQNILSDSILEAGLFDEDSVVINKPLIKGNKKRRGSFIPTIRGPKITEKTEEIPESVTVIKKSDRVTDAVSPTLNPRPRRLLRSSLIATEDQENNDPNKQPENKIVNKPQVRRKSLAAVSALLDSIELPEDKEQENKRSTRSRGGPANVISGLVTRITARGSKSIAPAASENKESISSETWLDI
jgi:hypothetical protein